MRFSHHVLCIQILFISFFWVAFLFGHEALIYLLCLLGLFYVLYADVFLSSLPLVLVGVCLDHVWQWSSVIVFQSGLLIPTWLILLWFAFTANIVLLWPILQKMKPFYLYLAFAFAATFNYYLGSRAGLCIWPYGVLGTLPLLLLAWAAYGIFYRYYMVYLKKHTSMAAAPRFYSLSDGDIS